jgi:drug/metabolite transporter (DMT)-like permease
MKTKDTVMFIALGLVWGSSFMWIKIALEEVGPFTLVAFRLLFGALGLALVVLWRKPEIPRSKVLWLKLAAIGLFNTALPFVLISAGEQVVDSAVTSILNGTVPLFTIGLAHVFLRDDRITLPRILGLLTGFVGVVIVMSRDTGQDGIEGALVGQIAILVAALSYGGSAVFARRNLSKISPMIQAFGPLVIADLFVWGALPIFESPFQFPKEATTWIALLWLGLLGSCLANLLYFSLLHSIGPTRTSLVTYILPVVGVTLGVLFLDEILDSRLILGAGMILFGVVVVNWSPKQKVESLKD